MSGVGTFAYRLVRRIRAFFSRAWLFTRRISSPFRVFRGPDILDVSPDGTVRVTRSAGPVPLRPRVVTNPSFSNPKTQRLARRAAIFLFEYFDFGAVPAQFWPVFEKTYDPGAAMEEFLRAVGCDPARVRRRDTAESHKAQEVIELLVRSGNILHDLAPHIRQVVGSQLESGDYATVRKVAEVVAHLRAALDLATPWSGRPVVASFADLLRTLQRMLANPLAVGAADAAAAASLMANFAEAQRQFEASVERFDGLREALRTVWPRDWHGTTNETVLRDHVGNFEAVVEAMHTNADLTWENLREGNESLRANLNALEDLLQQAQDFAGAPRGRDRRGGRGPGPTGAPPRSESEEALAYFGFSVGSPPASKQKLREAWKRKVKVLHPDANPGADEAELARLREEWNRCEQYFNLLLIHFSWHRPS